MRVAFLLVSLAASLALAQDINPVPACGVSLFPVFNSMSLVALIFPYPTMWSAISIGRGGVFFVKSHDVELLQYTSYIRHATAGSLVGLAAG